MKNEVATKQALTFTDEQRELIRRQVAPEATNDELMLFLHVSQKAGLDPMARQVYCVHRNHKQGNTWVKKMTIQTSIDGFRVIAQRSQDYAGQDEPEFIYSGDKAEILECAKIRVYKFDRNGGRYVAAVGVAFWDEFYPGDAQGMMWKKMPHVMLAKVAEAAALRKAFPQDLSNFYTEDEMHQAGSTLDIPAEVELTEAEVQELEELTEHYALLLEELAETKPEMAEKAKPENWKKAKNAKSFRAAIGAVEQELESIEESKQKENGENK